MGLHDYLSISAAQAAEQWRRVARRDFMKRQEPYLPIETLLTFGLGLRAQPDERGRMNLSRTDPLVQRLAALFKRSVRSLPRKLENLDGRSVNGAEFERELYVELTSSSQSYAPLYGVVLDGARAAGFDAELVPDFLGWESGALELVLTAGHSPDADLLDRLLADDSGDPKATEREVIARARVGQTQFANHVLGASAFRCAFCGLDPRQPGLRARRMLIASHIKPWKDSSDGERVDPRNGIAACPTHDAAFESGLIRVDAHGAISRSPRLSALLSPGNPWDRAFGDETLKDALLLLQGHPGPGPTFVDWHWRNVGITLEWVDERSAV